MGVVTPRKPFNPSQFALHFTTEPKYPQGDDKIHVIEARDTKWDSRLGQMIWDAQRGHIIRINVSRDVARKGLGTAMWNEGHRLAQESPDVVPPKHSRDRTLAGELWARRVGGELPPNKNPRTTEAADSVQRAHPRGGRWYTQWETLNPVIRDTEDDED
jgi:hypothetical protein